ncbi:MAG: Ferric uptake regulation protein [Syntrophorhabdaceae bacterium PtaU1.Bin034]|nr:MAG: Ferric uptake regulation protein [Syntrophorhabdaceae bacterium PtaU1.Bin034]
MKEKNLPGYTRRNVMQKRGILTNYLSKHGLKMTGQRETVLNEFLRREGHSTAEELTAAVKKKDKTIGQATVYRFLKILVRSGIGQEVRLGDGVVRYEYTMGLDHHDHLICERCGKTVEILDESIEKLQEKLAEEHGFVVTRHVMNIFGICEKCRTG